MTPEEARKLLRERRKRDPFYRFPLSPGQLAFARDRSLFKAIEGGNRTGKTAIMTWDATGVFRGIHPFRKNYGPGRYLMMTESRQQMAEVVGRKLFNESELPGDIGRYPMIPEWEISKLTLQKVPYPVPYKLEMKNGTEVLFSWAGVDAVWKRIQGLKLDGIFLDEDAGSSELLKELYSRLQDVQSDPTRPGGGFIVWSSTPTTGSQALEDFRRRCFDPNQTDHSIYRLVPGETGAISEEVIEAQRERLGEDDAKVRVDGTASRADLRAIFKDHWDDSRHVLADPYIIDPHDNLWLSYDPGVSHPTGMLILAISREHPRRLTAVRFFNHKRKTIDQDIDMLEEFLQGRVLAGVIYDPAAKKVEKSGLSTLGQLQQRFQQRNMSPHGPWLRGRNKHEDGIVAVHRYLRDGLFVMDPDANGKLGLQQGRWQMLNYRGREETKYTGPGGVIKKDDEFPDCLRYACMANLGYSPQYACGVSVIAQHKPRTIIAPRPSLDDPKTPEGETFNRHLELSRQSGQKRGRRQGRMRDMRWY